MIDNERTSIEDQERIGRPFVKENVDSVSEYINDYLFSSSSSILLQPSILIKKQLLKY